MTWNELSLWCDDWCRKLCRVDFPSLRDFVTHQEEMADMFSMLEGRHEGSIQAAVLAIIDGKPLPELEPGARLMLYEALSWARLMARSLANIAALGVIPESPADTQRAQEWLLFDAWLEEGFESIHGRIAQLLATAPPPKETWGRN